MKINLSNIKKAKKLLNLGECVAIPTETVYGLAGNAYSNKACTKIFNLKKRPKNNPLIVHYYNKVDLKKDCDFNNNFFKLYKKFCPGPITFVLKLKKESNISKNVTNNKKTLAIRFPSNQLTKKLLKFLNYPLAAPSANISTKISPVSKEDVKEEDMGLLKFLEDKSGGIIPLPVVLSEVNSTSGFLDSFSHFAQKGQKRRPSNKAFYAAIIAYGCNIGIGRMAMKVLQLK